MKIATRPNPRLRPRLVSEPWSRDPFADRPAPAGPFEAESERPRYRPPVGVPVPTRSPLASTLLSVALHVLVILLLIAPFVVHELRLEEVDGAGGAGPAGGGGGGRRGTGLGVVERLHYMQVAPPAAPTATPVPPVTPPVVPPPVVPPPVPPKPEPPQPVPAVEQPVTPAPQQTAPASVATGAEGTAGTGKDGTNGSGPGSGGGIGSGVGTGRGSGVGPGTGGGDATVYPPTPTEMFIQPIPVPSKVRGKEVLVVFDVDSTGKVLKFDFTPTPDGGYNKKLREIFASTRFRPATRSDGRPIRSNASMTYVF